MNNPQQLELEAQDYFSLGPYKYNSGIILMVKEWAWGCCKRGQD